MMSVWTRAVSCSIRDIDSAERQQRGRLDLAGHLARCVFHFVDGVELVDAGDLLAGVTVADPTVFTCQRDQDLLLLRFAGALRWYARSPINRRS